MRLPDELRQPLQQMAEAAGQTPEEWVTTLVQQQLVHKDARLRQHFGAVRLGADVDQPRHLAKSVTVE